jgi:hypothetical protein
MRQIRRARLNRRKRSNGGINMNELIKTFIGKNVIISGYSTDTEGIITKIEDNWIEVENRKGKKQLINCDYISRIKDYPLKKK